MMQGKRLLYWAAGLCMFAIAAHSIAAPDHFNEWWGYGVMFIVGAVFQFFYGVAVLIQPWKYDDKGGPRQDAERYGGKYYTLGIVLASLLILLYIITRTSGMPFLGKDAVAEPVTVRGLVPFAANVIVLFPLIKLLRGSQALSGEDSKTTPDSDL
jgi:hypothetical protein